MSGGAQPADAVADAIARASTCRPQAIALTTNAVERAELERRLHALR